MLFNPLVFLCVFMFFKSSKEFPKRFCIEILLGLWSHGNVHKTLISIPADVACSYGCWPCCCRLFAASFRCSSGSSRSEQMGATGAPSIQARGPPRGPATLAYSASGSAEGRAHRGAPGGAPVGNGPPLGAQGRVKSRYSSRQPDGQLRWSLHWGVHAAKDKEEAP